MHDYVTHSEFHMYSYDCHAQTSSNSLPAWQRRKEMARQVLSRYAPPTEEGVVYVPDWNENDAGGLRECVGV
jgi:hypothetical protein